MPEPAPILKAMVIAGLQAHPIWALDRLDLVIYCYVQSAKYNYPHGPQPIQVNVRSSLISSASASCIVADSIIRHASETIRADAELLIAKLTSGVRLTTEWPTETEMVLPVNGGL